MSKKILVADTKIFTIEQKFCNQNSRVYARTSYEAKAKVPRIERGHHLSFVMDGVWGVLWNGATANHFCAPGVKVIATIYEETFLELVVKPLIDL